MSKKGTGHRKYLVAATLAAILVLLFLGIYFMAKPTGGLLPSMPKPTIDETQMSFAVERMNKRAASVQQSSYHRELFAAFRAFNFAEAEGKDAKTIDALRLGFVDKTMISQTAQKERFLLFGDYLAVQFEKHLFAVLKEARQLGMKEAAKRNSDDYKKLIALSGNFLANSLRIGLISPSGELKAKKYMPQILFRKRWRILGELPFLLHFLEVEALVDSAYILQFGSSLSPGNTAQRLKAVERIQKQDKSFDSVIAKGLVLYQGKETKRALLELEKAKQQRPDDFVINEFLLFLSNGTE